MIEIADLLEPRLDTEEIDLPIGRVEVRGLSRFELLLAGKLAGDDTAVMEQHMLHMAMVSPAVSLEQAKAWQKASPAGEIRPVVETINRLSGVGQGADKSRLPGDGDGPDAGV